VETDTGRFTEREAAFLQGQRLGRLATAGASGKPHVVPVSYVFDPEREVLGPGFGPNWVEIVPNWATAWGIDEPALPSSSPGED
jgi:hypothetical protein